MTASSLDLLVAYTQHQSTPVVVVGLSSPPTLPYTSTSPFSDIVNGSTTPGFYASNDAAEKLFAGYKPWRQWTVETEEAVIGAINKCWAELTQPIAKNVFGATHAKLVTSSEKVAAHAGSTSEQLDGSVASPMQAWRVDIMATCHDAPSRLQSLGARGDDWVMILTVEGSVGPTDVVPSALDNAARRPSLSTINSNSTISSTLADSMPSPCSTSTDSSPFKSFANRRIEIKSGVPNAIRAASRTVQYTLPPDDLTAVKTGWTSTEEWTPTQERSVMDYMAPVQEEARSNAKGISAIEASRQQLEEEDSTLWDESVVAPVNTDELVNLATNCPVGMVLATPELRIYWVNKHWYEITQVEPGQDLNSWIENVHPDSMPTVMDILQGLMESKVKRTGDLKWKNGGWFTFTAQVSTDLEGNVTGVAATMDDCTQRKTLELAEMERMKNEEVSAQRRAEEASARTRVLVELQSQREVLERRTKEFAQMAEISSIALSCAMPDGELIWANKAFCELHDLQPHEINSWPDTVIDADIKLLQEKWSHTLRTHETLYSRHRLKNGRVLQAQTVPSIRGEDKENCTFVSAIMDVTSEVRHQQAVERLNEQRIEEQTRLAAEAEERRKAAVFQKEQQALLIDVTSHELRNSLNPITQSAILIKASLLEAQNRADKATADETKEGIDIQEDLEACDAIIDSANQMERVANDVLGLAQIQANQLAVTPVSFDLTTAMRSIHRMFQADCRAKGVQMTVEMGTGVQALGSRRLLKADPSRLTQTTVNLISNAMKFIVKSEKRQVRIRIDISLDKPEDSAPLTPPSEPTMLLEDNTPIYLYIAVHDTGPGLTEEELGKLFRRFSQANSDVHCQMGGSGLGLYIAKQLCGLQGGRIEAKSVLGEGATFQFFIQAWSVASADGNSAPDRPSSVPLRMPSMAVNPANSLHILVCDDNIINRKTLARQLKQHKHNVIMAEDGQEALNVIFACEKAGTPLDCVVLDVNMPVINGMDATRRLRAIEKDRGDQTGYWIVGCTGNARAEQIELALESGMSAVITKPYKLDEMLKVIRPPKPDVEDLSTSISSSVSTQIPHKKSTL